MAAEELPRLYLVTPPEIELSRFPARLDEVLDAHDIACVRLAMATRDEDAIARAADAVRQVCHAADVPLVISEHVGLVERFGLDGVHLIDGARSVRKVRKALGKDAIVGAFCGASRHDGMTAGEQGADYVSFGPLTPSALNTGEVAEIELFKWWSEMIEIPVVAEQGIGPDEAAALAPYADFLTFGEELWREDDAVQALTGLKSILERSLDRG